MTCTTLAQPTGALGADVAALVAHFAELGEQITAKLADPATLLLGQRAVRRSG
jgi:hypothetical protein